MASRIGIRSNDERFHSAWLVSFFVAMLTASSVAHSQIVQYTFGGNIGTEPAVFDSGGVFGPVGANLSGEPFTATFFLNLNLGYTLNLGSGMVSVYGPGQETDTGPIALPFGSPFISGSLTINGKTAAFYGSGLTEADFSADDHFDVTATSGSPDPAVTSIYLIMLEQFGVLPLAGLSAPATFTYYPGQTEIDSSNSFSITGHNAVATAGALVPNTVTISLPISVTPTALTFGLENAGSTSAVQEVALSGYSGHITAIDVSPNFKQTNDCGDAPAGGLCAIAVTFKPTSSGLKTGELTFDAAGTVYQVDLIGNFKTSLRSTSSRAAVNSPVTLSWTSATGATCTTAGFAAVEGWYGPDPAEYSAAVTQAAPGTYTYSVTCSSGTQASKSSVTVEYVLAPTVSMSASAHIIAIGQTVKLSWTSHNASECEASGGQKGQSGWDGTKPTKGSSNVKPSKAGEYTYKLVCSSGTLSATAEESLTVVQ